MNAKDVVKVYANTSSGNAKTPSRDTAFPRCLKVHVTTLRVQGAEKLHVTALEVQGAEKLHVTTLKVQGAEKLHVTKTGAVQGAEKLHVTKLKYC